MASDIYQSLDGWSTHPSKLFLHLVEWIIVICILQDQKRDHSCLQWVVIPLIWSAIRALMGESELNKVREPESMRLNLWGLNIDQEEQSILSHHRPTDESSDLLTSISTINSLLILFQLRSCINRDVTLAVNA